MKEYRNFQQIQFLYLKRMKLLDGGFVGNTSRLSCFSFCNQLQCFGGFLLLRQLTGAGPVVVVG